MSREQQNLIFIENKGRVIRYLQEKGSDSKTIEEIIRETDVGKSYVVSHVMGEVGLDDFFPQ